MNPDELAYKQLALSGYPFQMRVREEVKATENDHGWEVVSDEYAWSDRGRSKESSGYIDLVLRHMAIRSLRMVIECKRMRGEDARGLQWLFLVPANRATQTELVRGLTMAFAQRYNAHCVAWDDLLWDPPSLQAEFCVTYSDQPRQKPQLEGISAELLASTDGLLREELQIAHISKARFSAFYIPAIVTNAVLKACVFDAAAVPLGDGVIPPDKCRIEEVPYIRFRKSLTTEFPTGDGEVVDDLRVAARLRERTVFVINAGHLSNFLQACRLKGPQPGHTYAVLREP
jgi:hypothetical protein